MEPSAIAAFDTLATAHALEEAGVERKQAEIIAGAMRQATEADRDQLVTKADLKAEIAALKAEMLKVAVGAVAAIVLANAGLTVALVELLR